jgi:tetratricopeptide (TPR) repeat protein
MGERVSEGRVRGTSPGLPWKTAVGLVMEKIPLFVLSAAASFAAFVAQRQLGAMSSLDALDRSYRVDNTLVAYATYILKTFWPTDLAVIYQRQGAWPFGLVLLAGGFLAVVSWATWRLRRSHPYLMVGWLWFLGVLVPMIGIVQVGAQWMADRYTYISIIGLFIMIAWGGAELARRLAMPKKAVAALAMLVVAILVPVTRQQLMYWKDSRSLFSRAVAVTRDNWLAHHNLALALTGDGESEKADVHLQEALRITPRNPTVNRTRGHVQMNLGNPKRAAELYREVLAAKPDDLEALRWLAWIYATAEDAEIRSGYLALEHARAVAKANKVADAGQFDLLAAACAENGQFEEAVKAVQRACALAEAAGQDTRELRKRLELYKSGQPYRSKFERAKRGHVARAKGSP